MKIYTRIFIVIAALVSMVANGKADLEGAYHQACDFNANDFIS